MPQRFRNSHQKRRFGVKPDRNRAPGRSSSNIDPTTPEDISRHHNPNSTAPTEYINRKIAEDFHRNTARNKANKVIKEGRARCAEAAKKGDFTPQLNYRTQVLAGLLSKVEDGVKPRCPNKPEDCDDYEDWAKGKKEPERHGPSTESSLPGTPSNQISPKPVQSAKGKEPVRPYHSPVPNPPETSRNPTSPTPTRSAKGKEPVRPGSSTKPHPLETPLPTSCCEPKKSVRRKKKPLRPSRLPIGPDPGKIVLKAIAPEPEGSVKEEEPLRPWTLSPEASPPETPITPEPEISVKGKEAVMPTQSPEPNPLVTPPEPGTFTGKICLRMDKSVGLFVVAESSISRQPEDSQGQNGNHEGTSSGLGPPFHIGFANANEALKFNKQVENDPSLFQGDVSWAKEAGREYDSAQLIKGVKMNCTSQVVGGEARYTTFESPRRKEIAICPPVELSVLIDLPLFCTRASSYSEINPLGENAFRRGPGNLEKWGQIIVEFRQPGNVLGFRSDGKELLPPHFEAFLIWVHTLFAGKVIGKPKSEMSKERQDEQMNEFRRRATRKNFEAFWEYWYGFCSLQGIPSPYEM